MKHSFAGALRNYITVEHQVRTDDGIGGFMTAWEVLGLTWAEFKPLSFNERYFEGEIQHTEDFNAILRGYQSFELDERLADQYRVRSEGRLFHVANIRKKDYRSDWQVLRLKLWGATTEELAQPPLSQLYDGAFAYNGALIYD